ncbi:MAG: hypothetical protein AABZ53_03250 [Planctomycetota bacterium]
MITFAAQKDPVNNVTTCYGRLENVVLGRVVFVRRTTSPAKAKAALTIDQANAWLLKNAAKVDKHGKASTKRLLGRESV